MGFPALDQARDGIGDAVDAMVVYEFMPADGVGLTKLKRGLDILVQHFQSVEERAAAAERARSLARATKANGAGDA